MKKISLATRQKVIQLFKEETQIKEIAQILLNRENIKISYGSVWNIIESWRSSQSKSTEPVAEQPLLSEPNGHLVSFTPVLVQESPSVVGPSGCPLSRFIPQTPESQPQIQTPEVKNSDLEDSKGNISIPHEIKELQGKDATSTGPVTEIIRNQPTYDPYMEREIDIIDPDTDPDLVEPDIYTDPNADYDERYDEDPNNSRLRKDLTNYKSESEMPERRPERQMTVRPATTRGARQLQGFREIEKEENNSLGSVSGWSTITKQIEKDKAQRRHELAVIEQRQRYLEIAKQEIDQARNDLDMRESKILQVEPFLPLARQIQDLSLTVDDIIPCFSWIEMIKEKAAVERIDLKTAIHRVAQDLSSYLQLGGMEKSLEQKKGELQMLNSFIVNNQRAISTIIELQNHGVGIDQIYRVSKFLYEKFGKEWSNNGGAFKLDTKLCQQ